MLRQYEALLLTVPEITQDEERFIEKGVDRLAGAGKGSVVSFEKWGKFKLAYPVKKNNYGVYFLVRFDLPSDSEAMDEIKSFFSVKLHEVVMRSMFTKLDPRRSTAYQRPKSLEEAPAERGVDAFLKENKMDSLIAFEKSQEKTTQSRMQTQFSSGESDLDMDEADTEK